MLPIPTQRAWAAASGGVGLWLIGLSAQSWLAATLGSGVFIGIACVLAASIPLGRRVRAQRLEFAWWLGQRDATGSAAVVPHVPFRIRCYVRSRGKQAIDLTAVQPITADSTRLVAPKAGRVRVAAQARSEFSFVMVSDAAGRVVLHGLSVALRGPLGLFSVPLYFPNLLTIKVLPRTALLKTREHQIKSGLPVDRSGRSRLRRRGGGTDLHELRDFQPGDPFKSIAWKASARRGHLLVREVEQEVQQTLVLVLDVAGSMRHGRPGRRKLDFALELSASEARAWLDRGDRVGLVVIDDRVITHVVPGEGPAHMLRLYEALLGTTEVVDADLTAVDDTEVSEMVARYVRHQDGLEFLAKGGGYDMAALARHARERGSASERSGDLPRAASLAGAQLRRFCKEHGIILPHTDRPLSLDKSPGLMAGLKLAGGHTRAPRTILCVSDMEDVADYTTLSATARLLQRHGHDLAFWLPAQQHPPPRPGDEASFHYHRLLTRRDDHQMRKARSHFGKLGVPVSVVRPGPWDTSLVGRRPGRPLRVAG